MIRLNRSRPNESVPNKNSELPPDSQTGGTNRLVKLILLGSPGLTTGANMAQAEIVNNSTNAQTGILERRHFAHFSARPI